MTIVKGLERKDVRLAVVVYKHKLSRAKQSPALHAAIAWKLREHVVFLNK